METKTLMLDSVLALARDQKWEIVRDQIDGAVQTVTVTRAEGEYLALRAWSQQAQGGQGQIRNIAGQIASGLVSRQTVRRETHIAEREVQEMLLHHDYGNNSGFVLRVAEGEITEHWETASNYTVHQTVPGDYPIELTNLEYQRVPDANCAMAYYAIAQFKTIEVREHYVNRLLTATSAHNTELDRPSSHLWTAYAYQLPAPVGKSTATGGYGPLYEVLPTT